VAEDLKKHAERFQADNPDIEINWGPEFDRAP